MASNEEALLRILDWVDLQNTVVYIAGDHGPTSNSLNLPEYPNPLGILLLPKGLLSPAQLAVLRSNQQRLVSHTDVFFLMRELLDMSLREKAPRRLPTLVDEYHNDMKCSDRGAREDDPCMALPDTTARPLRLLEEQAALNRTCSEAGVPDESVGCLCTSIRTATNLGTAVQAVLSPSVAMIVEEINAYFLNASVCRVLKPEDFNVSFLSAFTVRSKNPKPRGSRTLVSDLGNFKRVNPKLGEAHKRSLRSRNKLLAVALDEINEKFLCPSFRCEYRIKITDVIHGTPTYEVMLDEYGVKMVDRDARSGRALPVRADRFSSECCLVDEFLVGPFFRNKAVNDSYFNMQKPWSDIFKPEARKARLCSCEACTAS